MTWLNKRNHGMMIFRYVQLIAATMFYLPGTISVPCVKRGRHHLHKTAFVNSNCIVECKTDLSQIKALQHAYL